MFTMEKLNVLMKINSVLSVQTNAILDSNWLVHASGMFWPILAKFMSWVINLNLILEFVNLLERGLVVQQNVPRSAVPQLNRNRTLAPLDHVPSNLKIMVVFVLSSPTQAGSWLGQDRSNVKVVEDGQKFHQQLSW